MQSNVALARRDGPSVAKVVDSDSGKLVVDEAAEDLERLRADEAAAKAAGFALKPPVYALGTRVIDIGRENFRRSREAFERKPLATDVLAQFVERIAQEQRADTRASLREFSMLPDGSLTRGQRSVAMTEHAFKQLLWRSGCPQASAAATYLATIPAARRAGEVNAWLKEAKDAEVIVRHRKGVTGRECFAVMSERYVPLDVDRIANLMRQVAPGDARAEVVYDGQRAEVMLEWHSDVQPERVCAGEIFRASAGFRSADDGTLAVTPIAGLTRNLCLNLIILDEAEINLGKRRHTSGDVATFLGSALATAVDRVRYFAEKWDAAKADKLTNVLGTPADLAGLPPAMRTTHYIRGIFRGLVKENAVALPGHKKQSLVTELECAWFKEPEMTRAGLVNAVTRAAHESKMGSVWGTAELEAAGGALLARKQPLRWADEF